jgi:Stigma-specific protein, Stig1
MRLRAVTLLAVVAAACNSAEPCPEPLVECTGQCVDLQSDRRHCGGCGLDCPSGTFCTGAQCSSGVAACDLRADGAFVTLGACGDRVRLWIRDEEFIARAEARLGVGPDARFVPVLVVQALSDCDPRWNWHASDVDASFVDQASIDPALECSACPTTIQNDVANWIATRRIWCPAGASVVSVEPRP